MTILSQKVNNHLSMITFSKTLVVLRTTWAVGSKFYPERETLPSLSSRNFVNQNQEPKICKKRNFYNLKLNKQCYFIIIVVASCCILYCTGTQLGTFLQIHRNVNICAKKLAFLPIVQLLSPCLIALSIRLYLVLRLER